MKLVNRTVRCLQRRLGQDQSGFTLPELLIAIVISGIIVGALASGFGVGVKAMHVGDAVSVFWMRMDQAHQVGARLVPAIGRHQQPARLVKGDQAFVFE